MHRRPLISPGRRLPRSLAEFRPGVRICLDWGAARVGVAACDRESLLCYPVETVPNDQQVWARLAQIVADYQPMEIILGMPINLGGVHGPAAEAMDRVADELVRLIDIPLRVVDERLSTASAHRRLAEVGRSSRKRRSVIDQAAAVAILDQALGRERHTGEPAGRVWMRKGDLDD